MKKLALITVLGGISSMSFGVTLWDQLLFDGQNGLSNGVFLGLDRKVANDFQITDPAWDIKDAHILYLWNGSGKGKATGVNVRFYKPGFGAPIATAGGVTWTEVDTGADAFGRDIIRFDINFNTVTLTTGTYWVDIQPVGPENGFQLTAAMKLSPVYVNYSDFTGGAWVPGNQVFGVDYDVAYSLTGDVVPEPATMIALGAGVAALVARRRRGRGRRDEIT